MGITDKMWLLKNNNAFPGKLLIIVLISPSMEEHLLVRYRKLCDFLILCWASIELDIN